MRRIVRLNTVKMRLWLGVGVAAVAAFATTGAFGGSGAGTITTFAGTGIPGFSGDGGPATSARLRPQGVAVDGKGKVYIAESGNGRVRRVGPDGTITTFAGIGKVYVSGDGGPATLAAIGYPEGVAVDGQGNVYIVDRANDNVRKVNPRGTITTIAGNPKAGNGFSGDGGPATSAQLFSPRAVAVDGKGNVYIADYQNYRVRRVSAGGTITTIAGNGKLGSSGDGGPATSAQLNYPVAVAVDRQGNVYIAEERGHRVRKVSPGGSITTFAGNGTQGFSGDGGPATSAQLAWPRGVAADGKGNVYIVDNWTNRVRMVRPDGTIRTIAGNGRAGNSGDGGPATSASLYAPWGVAADGKGNVYVADTGNGKVRRISGTSGATALALTLSGPSSQGLLAQKGISVTARCDKPCSLSATGSVRIVGARYVFALTRATAKLAAGKRTLTLRFPAAEQKRFRQLLKPGRQARAVITVKAKDTAGNTSTSKRTVVVQR
jgi:trimeric autotransporter adhesin